MPSAQPRTPNEFTLLRESLAETGPDRALRVVLAVTMDKEMAAWCLGRTSTAPVSQWPSTLYGMLARAAIESPAIWRRCAVLLDRMLHEAIAPYAERSAAELAEVFALGRESLSGEELAALLWCLIRRRSGAQDLVAKRLGQELEVIAAQRMRERNLC